MTELCVEHSDEKEWNAAVKRGADEPNDTGDRQLQVIDSANATQCQLSGMPFALVIVKSGRSGG